MQKISKKQVINQNKRKLDKNQTNYLSDENNTKRTKLEVSSSQTISLIESNKEQVRLVQLKNFHYKNNLILILQGKR